MTTTNTATKTKTQRRTAKLTTKPYAPAALTRVYDKATGVCLGYLAPSRDGREYYQVTCDENAIWHCTCKATIENCCHVKAAKELCEIRVKQGRPACRAASLPEITDEQMAAITAKAHEVADETPVAAEPVEANRDLVAVAATNAAKAGQAVDVLVASTAQSTRRTSAPINGSRGIGLAPIVAPTIKTSWLPMH